MQTVFIIVMIFVSIIALFAVLVVLRDIVKDIVKSAREEKEKKAASEQPAVEVVEEKKEAKKEIKKEVKEQPKEEPAKQVAEKEAAVTIDPSGKVVFAAGEKLTLDQKYAQLSKKEKARYDEIVAYAKKVEGTRCIKNDRYEEYKVGKNRLVRMLIKRGVIVCEFILENNNFKNFVIENKVSVKQSATAIKIVDENSVAIAKSSIDIAVVAINEEKAYKKQLAREKRLAKNKK